MFLNFLDGNIQGNEINTMFVETSIYYILTPRPGVDTKFIFNYRPFSIREFVLRIFLHIFFLVWCRFTICILQSLCRPELWVSLHSEIPIPPLRGVTTWSNTYFLISFSYCLLSRSINIIFYKCFNNNM